MITDELIAELIEQGKKIKTYSINKAAVGSAIELLLSARAEIERLKEAQRWIPVSERLPDEGECVFVFTKRKLVGMAFFRGVFKTYSNTVVTHWMPIPQPPEETE